MLNSFLFAIEVSRALLVEFVNVTVCRTFKKKSCVLPLEVSLFQKGVVRVDDLAARSIQKIMKRKADIRSKPFKKSILARSPDPVLKNIGIEQMQQILRKIFSIETTSKDSSECSSCSSDSSRSDTARLRSEMLASIFSPYSGRLRKDRAVYGQLQAHLHPKRISPYTVYYSLIQIPLPNWCAVPRTYVTGKLIGYTVQKITKVWITLAHSDVIRTILSRKHDDLAPRSHACDLAEATGPVSEKAEVAAEFWKRSVAFDNM